VHSLLTSTAVDPLGFTRDSFTSWKGGGSHRKCCRVPDQYCTPDAAVRQLPDNGHLLDDTGNRVIYLVEFKVRILNEIHDEIHLVELKNAVPRLTRIFLWLMELSAWVLDQRQSGTLVKEVRSMQEAYTRRRGD
jgi:hypothetical protein